MTSKRILSITKKIIRKAAEIGLDQAGALIIPGAWPYFKKVISPVVDELQRRYPKMLLVDDEEALRDSEKAVEALSTDKKLQKLLEDGFSRLEQGQEEILDELDRIDGILQGIGTSVDRLSEMTEDGFNQVLKAIKPTGKMAPGNLRIIDVRVTQNKQERTCFVDFWVSNDGGSQVVITAVQLEVGDTARGELVKGPMKASGSYDLDISDLRKAKQIASCPISQEVEPGKSDRFRVILKAESLGTGVFAAWVLLPKLITNYGEIEGKAVEVWLPFKELETFEELKQIEKMEKGHSG